MLKNKKAAVLVMSLTLCTLLVQNTTSEASDCWQEMMPAPEQTVQEAGECQEVFQEAAMAAEDAVQAARNEVEKSRREKEERERAEREAAARLQAEIEEAERLRAEQEAQALMQDQELLAAIIFCEAGNQSFTGQVAVGAVIMNRIRSEAYPDNMRDVIYQSGQFGPAVTGWLDQVLSNGSYTDSAVEAAVAAINGENPIGGCLYFDQGNNGMQIGDHYFH